MANATVLLVSLGCGAKRIVAVIFTIISDWHRATCALKFAIARRTPVLISTALLGAARYYNRGDCVPAL